MPPTWSAALLLSVSTSNCIDFTHIARTVTSDTYLLFGGKTADMTLLFFDCTAKGKGKVFPYSLPSVGPGADPGVQAVSPQVTGSESRQRPGSRLPLLSARPAVTSVAFTRWCNLQTAANIWFQLYYSFNDPERMKGWVGLVGWPVADGLPTLVVTHQLQVESRTGKVRQSETDVLPLCYATNPVIAL